MNKQKRSKLTKILLTWYKELVLNGDGWRLIDLCDIANLEGRLKEEFNGKN